MEVHMWFKPTYAFRCYEFESRLPHYVRVVEMADTAVSKAVIPTGLRVQVPRQAPYARVTELVYVSDSNPDAERRVSSNLTSRTIPGWCNGSTTGFDPVGRGSNPLLGAIRFHGQVG